MATNTTVVQGQVAAKPKAATGPWREAFGRLRPEPARGRRAGPRDPAPVLRDLRAVHRAVALPGSRTSRRSSPTATGRCRRSRPNHILGTDQLGRDLLSRLLDGARISVTVAFVVQAVIILHRRADRRDRRLVRWPDGQLPDAPHRRHLRLPGPPVHHPAVGRVPRDRLRPGARRTAAWCSSPSASSAG